MRNVMVWLRWEGVLLIKSGVIHSGRLLHPETGLLSPTNSVCRPASLPASLYHDHFRLLIKSEERKPAQDLIASVGGLFRQTIWLVHAA